jgi:LysM repeat protein
MAVMKVAAYPLRPRSWPAGVAPANDGRRPVAPLALIGSRSHGRRGRAGGGSRWHLHAAIVALLLSPLLLSWVWGVPLSAALPTAPVHAFYAGYWADVRRDGLPTLDPPAEDERPLVQRVAQYRVETGDTLHDVAQRFGISTETLLWANPLPDPDRLLPDQELTVLPVSGVLHTVGEGETVAVLAERYGADPTRLIVANGLWQPEGLLAGDRLLIPDGRPLESPTRTRAVPWPAPGTGVRHRQQFIEAAAAVAQESQRRTTVPASVTIAQAIHETGWGGSRLSTEAHNYFGIKGRNSPGPAGVVWMNTWEVIGGRNIIAREPFRAYHSPEESFFDHGLFFWSNRRYHGALAVADDPRAFAHAISAAGFATDPVYAAKIIRMMDQYNLYQYDLPKNGE